MRLFYVLKKVLSIFLFLALVAYGTYVAGGWELTIVQFTVMGYAVGMLALTVLFMWLWS